MSKRQQNLDNIKKLQVSKCQFINKTDYLMVNFSQDQNELDQFNQNVKNHPIVCYRGPTSKIIRQTFVDAGFHCGDKQIQQFNVCWAAPKGWSFIKKLQSYQIINQLAGQNVFTRKDNLATTIYEMNKKYPSLYSFAPLTFVLPECLLQLKMEMKNNPHQYYIYKLASGARGNGIKLLKSGDKFSHSSAAVVQHYLTNTLLIDGFKFDLRIYVLVTSVDPLIVYVYNEGLARFATHKWHKPTMKNYNDKTIHLTNFSVNKASETFKNMDGSEQSSDNNQMYSKMKLTVLLDYLENNKSQLFSKVTIKGSVKQHIQKQIDDIIRYIFIGANTQLVTKSQMAEANVFPRKQFGFYGFDVIILENMDLKLIEVNVCPSTGTSSELDHQVKSQLLKDMFDLIGFRVQFDQAKQLLKIPIYDSTFKSNEQFIKSQYSKDGEIITDYENLALQQIDDEQQRIGGFKRLLPTTQINYLNMIESHKRIHQLSIFHVDKNNQ